MSLLEELKILMDEAEAELIDPDTDLSDAKPAEGKSTGTALTIFTEEGYQQEFTQEFLKIREVVCDIMNNLAKEILSYNEEIKTGTISQTTYDTLIKTCTEYKKELNRVYESDYPKVMDKMTIMEQKCVEDGMSSAQATIAQVYVLLESLNVVAQIEDKQTTDIVPTQDNQTTVHPSNKDNKQQKPKSDFQKVYKSTMDLFEATKKYTSLQGKQLLDLLNEKLARALSILGYATLPIALAQDTLENLIIAIKNTCTFLGDFLKNIVSGIGQILDGLKVKDIAKELMQLSPLTYFISQNASILKSLLKLPIATVALVPNALAKTIDGITGKQSLSDKMNKEIEEIEDDDTLSDTAKAKKIKQIKQKYKELANKQKYQSFSMRHTKEKIANAKANADRADSLKQRQQSRQTQIKKAQTTLKNKQNKLKKDIASVIRQALK